MPNLSDYQTEILAAEDKPLFDEAVISAQGGALRGAYILVWLSCAESLKRKFKEAATRDNRAFQITTEIEAREASRQSADALILKRANEYELIDGVAFQKLTYVYDMRCVYGHPYESAPTEEELISAASVVATEVLKKPTLYRKTYVETLIERLTTNVDFLEQSKTSVQTYARDISVRIDPSSYRHLANVYSSKLETMYNDPSLADLVRRGVWFLTEFLKTVGTSFVTKAQWHEFVLGSPKISQMIFLSNEDLYNAIGRRANDSLISYALTNAATRPTGIKRLESAYVAGRLSDNQKQTFESLDLGIVKAARLKTNTAYNAIITGLKSHTWSPQNAAVDMLNSNDRSQISDLDDSQQENLGRNILQASQGDAGSANTYLSKLATDHSGYPTVFIKGVLFEGFVNESNKFRLKNEGVKRVLVLFNAYPEILEELLNQLDAAEPTGWTSTAEYDELIEEVITIPELSSLLEYLTQNNTRLRASPEQQV
ncbi:MAG: VrlM [Candidatus Saccharibacteria bacterium]|nr:VrlM [Candidatus Saccharibacteria bacterium]